MESKYLDEMMNLMLQTTFNDENILRNKPFAKRLVYGEARQLLLDRKYAISVYKDNLQLTPEGRRFINGGGFAMEDLIQKSSLESVNISKQSLKISMRAFWVAVITLGVALLAVFLQITFRQ